MRKNKLLETITTRFFFWTVILIVCVFLSLYFFLSTKLGYNISEFNKVVDTILKSLAVILGLIWFGNRYFKERKDIPKFDIQVDFNTIKLDSGQTLLIYRLDLFNKGNTLFNNYDFFFSIDGFRVDSNSILKDNIKRYPVSGLQEGRPIEPNSWTAINHEILIGSEYPAIRFYYEINENDTIVWSWHKTFKLDSN